MTTRIEGEWLSPAQAARILGVSSLWVRRLADSGKLTGVRTPLGRLVSAGSVERLAAERGLAAKPSRR